LVYDSPQLTAPRQYTDQHLQGAAKATQEKFGFIPLNATTSVQRPAELRRRDSSSTLQILQLLLRFSIIIIIIINPCKPYLTASAPRLTHWGGGK
jgi:hypothetical protein